MPHQPRNPAFAEEIRQSFAKQTIMGLIGAQLSRVDPGVIEITLPYRADLAQQHGYLHAGIVTTIADSACGYAAYSLMPPDSERGVQSQSTASGKGRRVCGSGRSYQSWKDAYRCSC